MGRIWLALGMFFLGIGWAQGAENGLEALRRASPEEAIQLAKRWREEGRGMVSFLTPRFIQFEFPTGAKARVELPKDRMVVAVAPYRSFTHPCATHYFSSCTGEMKDLPFHVQVLDGKGKVVFEGVVRTGMDGFLELWLPRNQRFSLEIRHGSWVAQGRVATFEDSPTCLTGFRLQ